MAGRDLIGQVREYCNRQRLLEWGDRVLLGFSGGADSVCLFLALEALSEEFGLSVLPVHLHHGLRGEEADRDAAFCEAFCRAHGKPLVLRVLPVRETAQREKLGLEEAGRMLRYEEFGRLMREHGATKLAVAHHQNDQAETVLFQLLRGSRLAGLAGIAPENGTLIRPLLGVTRAEIEAYLRARGETYCTDSTNGCADYTRNRIRRDLLPVAEEIRPGAVGRIAGTAEYLRRVERYLEQETDRLYARALVSGEEGKPDGRTEETKQGAGVSESAVAACALSIPELRSSDSLIAERVVYRVLCMLAGGKKDVTAQAVAACMELCGKQTGRRRSLLAGIVVERRYDRLVFRSGRGSDAARLSETADRIRDGRGKEASDAVPIPVQTLPCRIPLADTPFLRRCFGKGPPPGRGEAVLEASLAVRGGTWEEFRRKYGEIPKTTYTKWFDYDKIKDNILLRTLRPDDRLALYADGRTKRAADYLAERKLERSERDGMLLLAEGNRVLWIPGLRGSEAYRITEDTTHIFMVSIRGGRTDGGRDQGKDQGTDF